MGQGVWGAHMILVPCYKATNIKFRKNEYVIIWWNKAYLLRYKSEWNFYLQNRNRCR